jgi:hypothetical protein
MATISISAIGGGVHHHWHHLLITLHNNGGGGSSIIKSHGSGIRKMADVLILIAIVQAQNSNDSHQ